MAGFDGNEIMSRIRAFPTKDSFTFVTRIGRDWKTFRDNDEQLLRSALFMTKVENVMYVVIDDKDARDAVDSLANDAAAAINALNAIIESGNRTTPALRMYESISIGKGKQTGGRDRFAKFRRRPRKVPFAYL